MKTLTPIQELISQLKRRILTEPINERDLGYNHGLANAILSLEQQLPAEREFAEKMFEAGYKAGGNDGDYMQVENSTTFNETYKQFEP